MHSDVGRSSDMLSRSTKRESNVHAWIWQLLLVTLILAAGVYWRFSPWMPNVFYGDDLYNIIATLKDHVFVGTWQSALTSEFYEKYRPVFHLAWFALAHISHTDLRGFLAFVFFLQLANAVVFFTIAMELSNRNRVVSLVLAFTFATSRFALYQVTQATGMVEALALLFFLLTIAALLKTARHPEQKVWPWAVVALYFLCVHSHERYISVSPILAVAIALSRPHSGTRYLNRFAAAIVVLAIPILNILIKTAMLHSAFFVGTGSTHLDINAARIVDFCKQAIFSIFGFNYGPEYLVGHSIVFDVDVPGDTISRSLAGTFTVSTFIAVCYSLISEEKISARKIAYPLFGIVLIVLLLVPPVLTIRVEQRWLYAPFAVVLGLLAWASRYSGRKVLIPFSACLIGCTSLIVLETRLAEFFPRTYLVYSSTVARIAKRDLIDTHAAPVGGDLVLQLAPENCGWTFIEGRFFELYEGKARHAYCARDSQGLAALRQQHPSARAFIYTPGVSFTPAPGNK
jgi:hypothetical protein